MFLLKVNRKHGGTLVSPLQQGDHALRQLCVEKVAKTGDRTRYMTKDEPQQSIPRTFLIRRLPCGVLHFGVTAASPRRGYRAGELKARFMLASLRESHESGGGGGHYRESIREQSQLYQRLQTPFSVLDVLHT